MEIREIEITDIHCGERLRKVDPAWVALLARMIAEEGQATPVDVRPRPAGGFELIAGAHRVWACSAAGKTTVLACVKDVDDLTAQLLEVDENLMRHELTTLDRAAFLARRKELYLVKFPQSKQGGRGGKRKTELEFVLPETFAADAAKRLQMTDRWIMALIAMHRGLTPEARDALSATRLADNAHLLMEIAKLQPAEQAPVVREMTVAATPAKSVANAVSRLFNRKVKDEVSPTDKRYRSFVAAWYAGDDAFQGQVIAFLKCNGFKFAHKPANQKGE